MEISERSCRSRIFERWLAARVFSATASSKEVYDQNYKFLFGVYTPNDPLTEPLSVAVHAVAESGGDAACAYAVFGCGPVGLFVITRLKALGYGPVLAIEPNAARRAMAERMGADIVAAPGDAGIEGWFNELGLPFGLSDAMAQAPELKKRERAVLFDCVGKPGMIMGIAQSAPVASTSAVTTAPNAPPMTTATARSITLPRRRNCRKPLSITPSP